MTGALLILSFVILVVYVNAANLLISKQYFGQTTCSGTPDTLSLDELGCETDNDTSTLRSCDGVFAYDKPNCQGEALLLFSVGTGCLGSSLFNFAAERACVDADWYKIVTSISSQQCAGNT